MIWLNRPITVIISPLIILVSVLWIAPSYLKTKDVEIGESFIKEKIKTGITVANLPLVGTLYTGHYVGQKDYEDRMNRRDEDANKRY